MTDTTQTRLLRPGDTCWRIARADRVAVIIDAADYFATIRAAVQKARHSVLLIGWDFDTRVALEHDPEDTEAPVKLGEFLTWVVDQRPELQVYVLKWDLGSVGALGRGTTPLFILDWMTSKRVHFKLDGAHPPSAAHHQKVVVVDDSLAFCGGIDITADRWDTREHRDDDPRRVRPTTKRPYGPWHDVSTAVDGEAARALGDLARDRWKRATAEDLEPAPPMDSAWPEGLTPSFRDVDVALSRTMPPYDDEPGIHEIESLYLAAIAAAQKTIYIESQYFASRRIAEAMADRLRETGGPEIVVVNPESAQGWLEEEIMGASRARLLKLIGDADQHDRFRLYTPVTEGGADIYVHAKVMVIDDRLLKVGSSNLNNRSLGFDTECDLSIEALPGAADRDALARTITGLRTDLLSEHLGIRNAVFERALERNNGSLIRTIEELRTDRRSLVPFVPPDLGEMKEAVLAENTLLDPERPANQKRTLRRALRRLFPF